MLEMLATLSHVLHRFSFTVDESHKVIDITHITYAPQTGIKLFIHPRMD